MGHDLGTVSGEVRREEVVELMEVNFGCYNQLNIYYRCLSKSYVFAYIMLQIYADRYGPLLPVYL